MKNCKFSPYHLKYLLCHQTNFHTNLVSNKLLNNTNDKHSIYREFIIPVILSIEQDWVNGRISPSTLFKASRRILKMTEELSGDCSYLVSNEERVLIGSFRSTYTSAYALLKSLLISQGKAVLDLGVNLKPQDFFSGCVQTGIMKIYISLYSSDDLKQLNKFINLYQQSYKYQSDNLEIICGGIAIDRIPFENNYKNILKPLKYLSDLLIEKERFEKVAI